MSRLYRHIRQAAIPARVVLGTAPFSNQYLVYEFPFCAMHIFFFFRYCAGQRFIAALSHTGGQARKN